MYRVLFAMHRKDGMSAEDFVAHYRESHIPITRRFAGLRHYEVLTVTGGEGKDAPDAFAVMPFDTEEDFQAVFSSPEFAEDSGRFVGRASSYVVDRIPVVASEGAVR